MVLAASGWARLLSHAGLWLMLAALPLPALAASPLPGDAVCTACHITQAKPYRTTPMFDALERVDACSLLKKHPDLSFQEGPYRSRVVRQGEIGRAHV